MRLARSGDPIVAGEGNVLGATYFEDNPKPNVIYESSFYNPAVLLAANEKEIAALYGTRPKKATILGVE